MKIYISIPITGCDELKQRAHADLIKSKLSKQGYRVVNPFDIYPGKNPTYADYLCCDLRALADCDAIYMCKNWQYSRGCRIERNFAQEFGLEVIRDENEVKEKGLNINQQY